MQPRYSPFAPPRSGIPRVVGILAIVFAVLGLAFSILFTWGPLDDIGRRGVDRMGRHGGFVINWIYIWIAISFLLFVLHLIGGVLAVTYRRLGLRLLTAYAVAALVLVVADLLILHGFVSGRRFMESLVWPRTGFAAIAAVWPIIVLALVNTKNAKAACDS
jgi:hypothetical protein